MLKWNVKGFERGLLQAFYFSEGENVFEAPEVKGEKVLNLKAGDYDFPFK